MPDRVFVRTLRAASIDPIATIRKDLSRVVARDTRETVKL
jgi:hypothetical protein